MNETLNLILIFAAGLALGALFFGGLWLTVKKIATSTQPSLLVFCSLIVRTGLVLIGFYFIGAESWQRLLIILSGFIIARFLVIHFTKKIEVKKEVPNET